jgi:molybdate/tungstate transport system substrate-binding protein
MLSLFSCKAKEETPKAAPSTGQLTIYQDSSVSVPLEGVTAAFQKSHPGVTVKAEAAGSLELARRIADKGEKADVVILSDYAIIEKSLMPKSAEWCLKFARNFMTVAFTEKSQHAGDVNTFNWYTYLSKPGVKMGYADPNSDPAGYRALMGMQLSERYYDKKGLAEDLKKNCPPENLCPMTSELVAMLKSGKLDYAWIYRSEAKQHGLKMIVLPPEADLSSGSFDEMYKKVTVEITGVSGAKQTVAGEPTIYGVTIPTGAAAQPVAIAYLEALLGPAGQEAFKKNAQMPIAPCEASDKGKVPGALVKFCK